MDKTNSSSLFFYSLDTGIRCLKRVRAPFLVNYLEGEEMQACYSEEVRAAVLSVAREVQLSAGTIAIIESEWGQVPLDVFLDFAGDEGGKLDDLMERLSEDPSADVRCLIAKNTDSESILLKLAVDSDPDVRLAVANNPEITPQVVILCSKDKDPEVRLTIASRLTCTVPWETRRRLAENDPDPRVREVTRRRLRW